MQRLRFTVVVLGILLTIVVMQGCDEPVYQDSAAPRQATAAPEEPQKERAAPSRTGGSSALGGAVRSARRLEDRVEDHQRRIEDEIPD